MLDLTSLEQLAKDHIAYQEEVKNLGTGYIMSLEECRRLSAFNHAVTPSTILKLLEILKIQSEVLEKLDSWQGKQGCDASVFHIDDEEFGKMQSLIHEALAKGRDLLGEQNGS